MDLKNGYPYWAVKSGLMHTFPQPDTDLGCNVAAVGVAMGLASFARLERQ